jgi:hypothetical protein
MARGWEVSVKFVSTLAVSVLLCVLLVVPSCADNSITRSVYLVDAYNRGSQAATAFHLVIKGITTDDLDSGGYYDDSYTQPDVFQDSAGVHISWPASTAVGQHDMFGFTVNGPVQFTSCQMYFTAGLVRIWTIDDVWQDWTMSSGSALDTVKNRSTGRRYVKRTGGRSADSLDIYQLAYLTPPPPLPITIDSAIVPIDTTTPLSFGYSAYPGYSTYLMYYDQYAAGAGVPGSLLVSFRTAAVVAPAATLSFAPNIAIPDHFWLPGNTDLYNEMLSLTASAGAEDVEWDDVTLTPSGYGDDSADIFSVDVWLDSNNNGVVDDADTWLGWGYYLADDTPTTIYFDNPPIVPANGNVKALVSYTMAGSGWPCADYKFSLTDAAGFGIESGSDAVVSGIPLDSARTMMAGIPVSIAAVKLQQPSIASPTFLQDKTVTAYIRGCAYDQLYVEEDDRFSGIAVMLPAAVSPICSVGDRLSVNGVVNSSGPEAILFADCWAVGAHATPPKPIAMTNKTSGGGAFGLQRSMTDYAAATPAVQSSGTNSVGLLVRLYGHVTGSGQVTLAGVSRNVVWIDDGSSLCDGLLTSGGQPSWGVAVVVPTGMTTPATGTRWGVSGVLSTATGLGHPIRLLIPRTASDFRQY